MIRRVRRQFIAITMAMLTTVLMVPGGIEYDHRCHEAITRPGTCWNKSQSVKQKPGKIPPAARLTCPRMIFPRAAQ